MAGQIEAYRKEIFDFLRTVTIKFEPFAYLMGKDYMEEHGETNPHASWNPYYINLAGEYAPNDTRMEVYSLEEEGVLVPFDKNLITDYPKTAALYKIPRSEYTTLEERYPENIGLIRTIAYPIKDIQTAIDADNLTLLAYDSSLLDINERYDLVECLKEFLDMMRERWWTVEYTYENMYAATFWALLWQQLPLVLLTRRFKNIRTPYVHSFHIWEFLKSKGLKDYRDVLTNNQALWLYRNINWVQGNQGKNITLEELADNLLEEISVSLNYKDMYQETDTRWNEVKTTPEFITEGLLTGERTDVESTEEFNNRLVESGLETENSAEYIDQLEDQLSSQPHVHLPTKFLEFKKDPINSANEQLMCNFFINTLAYRLSVNHLAFNTSVTDPYTNTTLDIYMGDLALLWSYALYRSIGQEPTNIPNKFLCYLPFKKDQVLTSEFRQNIWYNQHKYRVASLVNVDGISEILGPEWHPRPYVDKDDWINNLADQFRNLLLIRRYYESSNDYLYHKAMNSVLEDVRYRGTVSFNLTSYTTYQEWFASNEILNEIITTYNNLADPDTNYNNLAIACFEALFPLTDVMRDEFVGTLRNMESIYNSVRDLFIRLGSYNITYLETERDRNYYLAYRDPDFVVPTEVKFNYNHFFDLIYEDFRMRYKIIERLMNTRVLHTINTELKSLKTTLKGTLRVEYPILHEIKYVMEHKIINTNLYFKGQPIIKYKFKLHTAATSCKYRG